MKKFILLAASLCCLTAAVAVAAEKSESMPAAPLQAPTAGQSSVTTLKVSSIEELFKNSEALNHKKVAIHGQAVKVTTNIMGKNWIHVQDGTGDQSKVTNDVICISANDLAEVGEEVTIAGTLTFNPTKRYKLVIEEATIIR